jgi:hypothetical protein
MPTTEPAPFAQQGLPGNLGAYSLSLLGLAALVPASGRLLPQRVTALTSRPVRALVSRAGARDL